MSETLNRHWINHLRRELWSTASSCLEEQPTTTIVLRRDNYLVTIKNWISSSRSLQMLKPSSSRRWLNLKDGIQQDTDILRLQWMFSLWISCRAQTGAMWTTGWWSCTYRPYNLPTITLPNNWITILWSILPGVSPERLKNHKLSISFMKDVLSVRISKHRTLRLDSSSEPWRADRSNGGESVRGEGHGQGLQWGSWGRSQSWWFNHEGSHHNHIGTNKKKVSRCRWKSDKISLGKWNFMRVFEPWTSRTKWTLLLTGRENVSKEMRSQGRQKECEITWKMVIFPTFKTQIY